MLRRKTEDFIEAKLSGGLGNQLFIFAAGFSLAKKYDCQLVLDTSAFHAQNHRPLEIDHFKNEQIIFRNFEKTQRRLISQKTRRYFEKEFNYSKEFLNVKPGTRIEGYFQSPKYFESVSEEMLGFLNLKKFEKPDSQAIAWQLESENVSVHIRRGDYLQGSQKDFHGLATPHYFGRAVKLMGKLVPDKRFTLFTDSLELLNEEFFETSFLSLKSDVIFDERSSVSDWATLIAMSKGSGMVMSNSSFSWWAAWLMSRSAPGPVIAPRPWFDKGPDTRDLLLSDWITLDSRI